jgi:eukaryotic-like serine/threonine-protein kinase
MDLWNDYEGKTIAGKFLLERLLYPEGRNGFFATHNGSGRPAVIRLTESLNDQEEILEQWRIVRDLDHPNLITIKSYGEVVVDDSPLVYAVLETSDATLADMLKERKMTVEETREIAESLIPALRGLHEAGLMHGCLEPASVAAVGEVVKLRSDCVRRLPDEQDVSQRKAADVQCLAALFSEALTQRRAQPSAPLPAPFDAIVRNGMAGTWGLDEMSTALNPPMPPSRPPATTYPASPQPAHAGQVPASRGELRGVTVTEPPEAVPSAQRATSMESPGEPWPRRSRPWIVLGVLVAVILGAIFYFHRGPRTPSSTRQSAGTQSSAPASTPQQGTDPNQAIAPASAAVTASVTNEPAAPSQSASQATIPPSTANQPAASASADEKLPASPGQRVWRLVVYTYNQQAQAQNKVNSIDRRHESFKPEVFTPSRAAPFLVTLGGAMSHEEAIALKRKAVTEGFPRDSYVQNYSTK